MGTKKSDLGSKLRIGLWIAVGVAALAGLAVLLGEVQRGAWLGGTRSAVFRIHEPFTLTTQKGEQFSSESLKGHPYMVFFGYTHCPDICPTTLQEVSTHLADLGDKAGQLKVLFITVDPARDTAENLASYLSSFDSRIIGLTGSEAQIRHVAKLYHAYFEKVEPSGDSDDYAMNHTASVYLFDRSGKLVSTLNWQEKASVRQAKLEKLLTR